MGRNIFYYLASLLLLAGLIPIASAQHIVGTASILAPAVLTNNTGSLTKITLTITNGTGVVKVTGPSSIGADTNQSAVNAAAYAAQYLGRSETSYNFTYAIANHTQSVSGPSAGAAMTMLAISALTGKSLPASFTMTGTIQNGAIGPVGGVYDKTAAATAAGLKFILVPAVGQGSQENELYYLIQNKFGIPVVEVPNISTAANYVFGAASPYNSLTTFNFYTNYHAGVAPPAPLTCSNSCNIAPFAMLANFTINFTTAQIVKIIGFRNATAQMYQTENQSLAAVQKGYLYTGGDISFLNYINAFYLSNNNATTGSSVVQLSQISSFCSSLNPPQLTAKNYDWVLAAELRQAWGNYTISQILTAFNVSSYATDDVLASLYSGGEANAWCRASSYIYSTVPAVFGSSSGAGLVANGNLTAIAQGRIKRASLYPSSVYLKTAQSAFASKNYPLAIMDADYGYSGGLAAASSSMNTSTLIAAAQALAANSTYGAWATQFANQAEFYAHNAQTSSNVSQAKILASQAYSSALLAQQMSNDTKIIGQNLVPSTSIPATTTVTLPQTTTSYRPALLDVVAVLVVVVIVLDIIILIILRRIEIKLKMGKSKRTRR